MFWYECKKTLFRPTVLVWMILLLLSNCVLYGLWNQSQGIDGELYQKLQVLTDTQLEQADSSLAKDRILKERQGLKDYPAYLENILKSDIGTISIFSDSLMSQQEERVKSHYVGKNLSAGNHSEGTLSIERLQEYWLWLIPEILFLIYLLIQIVQKDKESNFSEYIQTLPKGSISCYVTRLGAVLLTMAVFTILTCLTMIGIGIGLYGPVDPGLPVQSVLNLRSICDPLSIGQFLVYWTVTKILVILMTSTLFYAFCSITKNVWMGLGIGCIAFGVCHALSLVPEDIQNVLNFLNLTALLDPLDAYIHVRYWFIGNLIVYHPYLYGAFIIVVWIITACGYRGFISNQQWISLKFHLHRNHTCHTLTLYTFKIFWIHQKGLLFLILVLIFTAGWLWNTRSFSSVYDVQINEYIDTLGSMPTDEMLQEEATYFQQLHRDLDTAEDPLQKQIIQEELNQESGFELYQLRMQNARSLQKEKLIKEDQCRLFFGNDTFRQTVFLLLITLLMFTVYKNKNRDDHSGMSHYQKVLPYRQEVLLSQWFSMGVLGTLAVLGINLLMITRNLQIYPVNIYFENVRNLMDVHIPIHLPIWGYLFLQTGIQVLAVWIMSYLWLELFERVHHKTLWFLSLCILLAIPLLLDYLWIWINPLWISLFYPFESLIIFSITLLIMLGISLFMLWFRKKGE